jgi:quercetin dioxygenase-like cupin family protein
LLKGAIMSLSLDSLVAHGDELPEEVFEWGTLRWLCNDRISPGAAQTLGICRIWPGKRNPLHYHPNCEELLYVLAGKGRHQLDKEVIELSERTALRIPAGVRHNFANIGGETLVCLICFSSGDRQTVFVDGP